jgi:hypothetical protein
MKNMKKLNISSWVSFIVFMMILACETLDETFEEFTKNGETIYIGRSDTVMVASGYDKLRFWVAINSDPKISKGVVESNQGSVKHEFDVVRTKNGKDTISFDLDIAEGEYTFGLFLLDRNGNRSVRQEFQARVYGEKYRKSLINRGISNIEAYETSATFHWSDATPNTITTDLTYEDGAGVMQTVNVPNDVTQTTIDSYKRGGKIIVTSTYKPTENAIEVFEADPSERAFSQDFLLVKSIITPLKLQYDATEGCYASTYARLTDGSTDTYWHSCGVGSDRYPWVMSFDMGVEANLSRFRLDKRADCCGSRSPAAYQIWGTNDLTNAVTADIDAGSLADWEADAAAKGWVKLLDVSGNDQATFEVDVPENASGFRYVRIVGISAIDGGLTANFNEFTFWTK